MKKKRILCGFTAMAVLLSAVPVTAWNPLEGEEEVTYEGAGYSSAEEAAFAFLTYLQNNDVRGMASTFAIESLVEHVDASAWIDRYKMVYPFNTDSFTVPVSDAMMPILEAQRYSSVTTEIYSMYLNLIWPEEIMGELSSQVYSANDVDTAAYQEAVMNTELSDILANIAVGDVVPPTELSVGDAYLNERNQENIDVRRQAYGAEELTDVAVSLVLEGEEYLFLPSCIRYEDRWYLLNAKGILAVLAGIAGSDSALVTAVLLE